MHCTPGSGRYAPYISTHYVNVLSRCVDVFDLLIFDSFRWKGVFLVRFTRCASNSKRWLKYIDLALTMSVMVRWPYSIIHYTKTPDDDLRQMWTTPHGKGVRTFSFTYVSLKWQNWDITASSYRRANGRQKRRMPRTMSRFFARYGTILLLRMCNSPDVSVQQSVMIPTFI